LGDSSSQRASSDAASELAALRQQVEALREAVQARNDFIAIAAHELRNPMTPLSGLTELALAAARKADGTCPPRVTALLERLQQAVQEYIGRATRLLDITRLETGNLQLEPRPIDLSQIVLATVRKYAVAAAHQRCHLEPDIGEGISGLLDPLAVEQVVENLLSNALKFGAARPVTLRLRSERHVAQLDVRDRGIGMSPEQQTRIFGRFEQIVSHHRGSGFGVGLWVANRLVSAMGGRITVSSRPGDGSTFTVMLPLSPPTLDRTPHDRA
jgi:two-component system OmpR family sensor kinase